MRNEELGMPRTQTSLISDFEFRISDFPTGHPFDVPNPVDINHFGSPGASGQQLKTHNSKLITRSLEPLK
jgi:hypothetical protein